jgi:Na+-transporting methylmalonyl-CoA/oxaloacetate decarboxylase gamma subunit
MDFMNLTTIMQASESVMRKSEEMAVKDEHGLIITLVSISVVFAALIILYFAYTLIGKLASGSIRLQNLQGRKAEVQQTAAPAEDDAETAAAIAMAMHMYLNDTVHDMESYKITIRRRK